MPDRIQRTGLRWFVYGVLFTLAVFVSILSIVAWYQREELNNQGQRLGVVERVDDTAEVATCYASARGRPRLAQLLRVLAAAATSDEGRRIVNQAITEYTGDVRTVAECDQLAVIRGLDPKDFAPPPPPPSKEGR